MTNLMNGQKCLFYFTFTQKNAKIKKIILSLFSSSKNYFYYTNLSIQQYFKPPRGGGNNHECHRWINGQSSKRTLSLFYITPPPHRMTNLMNRQQCLWNRPWLCLGLYFLLFSPKTKRKNIIFVFQFLELFVFDKYFKFQRGGGDWHECHSWMK